MTVIGKNNVEEQLRCEPWALAHDFRTHFGKLTVAEGHCCDMEGCIALFERIDPEVKLIETYAGDVPDTLYVRLSTGKWTAYRPGKADAVSSP